MMWKVRKEGVEERGFLLPSLASSVLFPPRKLLGIHFGLHGSLHITSGSNGRYLFPSMSFSRRASQGEVFELFGRAFGGSVAKYASSCSALSQPRCVWLASGEPALRVCRALGEFSSPLQDRLRFLGRLSSWPKEQILRRELKRDLSSIEWDRNRRLGIQSLQDAAHLFDSSGSLLVQGARSDKLRVFVSCPTLGDWEALTDLAKGELGTSIHIGRLPVRGKDNVGRVQCLWAITHSASSRDFLTLIREHLILKKSTVEVGLRLSPRGDVQNLREWYRDTDCDYRYSYRVLPEYQALARKLRSAESSVKKYPSRSDLKAKVEVCRRQLKELKLENQIHVMKALLVSFKEKM